GAPFPNTGMYVLTDDLTPAPVGVPGEVYIDGTGLTRGYHNRPDLTAEKYLPNPHGPAGSRLYATGDLARRLPDGTLETLGRIDNQVKIRGYRIELGEIEARLREHPHITDTVVTVREPSPGNKRLTAYLVTTTTLDTAALRTHLGTVLPDYMVPAAYLTIDAIPLTANGKVDTRALPAPDLDAFTTSDYTAPRTPLEERLAAIWADVLDLPQIGIEDSFFDLGGDSIRAVQVLAKCREAGVPLALWMMLQAKSLAEVAGMIDAESAAPAGGAGIPLTPSQHRLLGSADGGARTVRLALGRLPDDALLAAALGAVVERHEALRLRLSADGRTAEPVPAPAGTALLSVLDLGAVAPVDRAGEIESAVARDRAALAPSEGAMLRATLVRFDDEKRHELWLTIHQLAADAASWSIVLADLNAAYERSAAGAPALPAPVEVPWRAWAQELGEQALSERVADQAEHWLNRVAAVPLPVDRFGQAPCRATEETVTVVLPAERTAVLLADPRPEQALLTALGHTLAQWAGGDRIALDVLTDPRHRQPLAAELADTVGPLADLHPVVLRIPKGRELSAVHTAVARQLRSVPAPAHGYGLLRYLAPDADLAEELAELPAGEVRFSFTPEPPAVVADPAASKPSTASKPSAAAELDGEPPLVFVPGRIELRAAPDVPSTHLLDVAAEVYDGRLYLHWTYNTAVHEPATVQRLADEQLRGVDELVGQAGDRPAASSRGRSAGAPAAVAGVAEVMARHGIPGASLALIRNGELAAIEHFGVLGVEEPAPVTAETLFPAGSISKHVTTFALLRLVEAGVIELDRDVNEYLTSWRVPSLPGVSTPVTPRLLIANLSGIAPHPAIDGNYHRHDPVPTVLDVLNGRPPAITPPARLLDEPGATFRQIPLNYSVLQQAMADATGEEFPALVHRLVLAPLGMTSSGFGVAFPDELGRPYARGHHADGTPVSGGYVLNPELAAGGLWTTATDLARLAVEVRRCHLGHPGGLVGAELVGRMLAPQSGRSYGWSTIVDDTGGDLEFGHGGQAVGFQAMTGLRVHSGTGVVLLSNAVTGRELVKHLLATVWTGQNRLAHLWQQAINEATEAESRLS
ncbi:serine hydrolase, partial [Kitasatospora sp. NPDC050463]|uniref:serine hydrolase domain-containing protein n=1 Tax=Kitasatospora sp. NPDC050463 TaxID=3155786 RepID=UPI0033C510E0